MKKIALPFVAAFIAIALGTQPTAASSVSAADLANIIGRRSDLLIKLEVTQTTGDVVKLTAEDGVVLAILDPETNQRFGLLPTVSSDGLGVAFKVFELREPSKGKVLERLLVREEFKVPLEGEGITAVGSGFKVRVKALEKTARKLQKDQIIPDDETCCTSCGGWTACGCAVSWPSGTPGPGGSCNSCCYRSCC